MKRRRKLGPHLAWAPTQGHPLLPHDSCTVCQSLQPLPELRESEAGKLRLGPHVLAANPPHALTRLGPAGRQAVKGSVGAQLGTTGHQPRPDLPLGSFCLLSSPTTELGPAQFVYQATGKLWAAWPVSCTLTSSPEPTRYGAWRGRNPGSPLFRTPPPGLP